MVPESVELFEFIVLNFGSISIYFVLLPTDSIYCFTYLLSKVLHLQYCYSYYSFLFYFIVTFMALFPFSLPLLLFFILFFVFSFSPPLLLFFILFFVFFALFLVVVANYNVNFFTKESIIFVPSLMAWI